MTLDAEARRIRTLSPPGAGWQTLQALAGSPTPMIASRIAVTARYSVGAVRNLLHTAHLAGLVHVTAGDGAAKPMEWSLTDAGRVFLLEHDRARG